MTTEPATPPSPGDRHPAEPLALVARRALHVAVGLTVLGVQQFQANRPQIERDLNDLHLPALARATGATGRFIEDRVNRLLVGGASGSSSGAASGPTP
jgi:hypothetical protein